MSVQESSMPGAAPQVVPAAKPLTKLFGNKVVIAEDDAGDRELLKETLGEWVALDRMKFVTNGDELMDYLYVRGKYATGRYPRKGAEEAPSMIILDLNMPGKDGIAALREIKADPRFDTVPVIILTGTTSDREIEQVFQLGANAFLSKPFDITDMALAMMQGFNFSSNM